MRNVLCTILFAGSMTGALAQNGQLSLGLNTAYYPSGVAGLGVVLDYRWRLGTHLEAIGDLSLNRFWWLAPRWDDHVVIRSGWNDERQYVALGGLGLGYRSFKDNGFHIGVLAGGVRYSEVDAQGLPAMMVRPTVALTAGHGIGQHLDVSLDTWGLITKKGEFTALPMLRVVYKFGHKKR